MKDYRLIKKIFNIHSLFIFLILSIKLPIVTNLGINLFVSKNIVYSSLFLITAFFEHDIYNNINASEAKKYIKKLILWYSLYFVLIEIVLYFVFFNMAVITNSAVYRAYGLECLAFVSVFVLINKHISRNI